MSTQYDLFAAIPQQQFEAWRQLPGAKHVLKDAFRITASYVPQWKKSGISVSFALIAELIRHRVKHVHSRAVAREIKAASMDGFSMNNSLSASVARFIMERRPEWVGIFQTRELGSTNKPRRCVVVAIKERMG